MRNVVLGVILIAVAMVAYVAAGPYLLSRQLTKALQNQDAELLADIVDFVALRANLKEQLNARMMTLAAKEMSDSPLGALGVAFGAKMIDGVVDSMVTPSGLTQVIAGKIKDAGKRAPSSSDSNTLGRNPFEGARYTVDSLSKVSIWAQPVDANGGPIRFVLTRDLVKWRLSNIVIPLDES